MAYKLTDYLSLMDLLQEDAAAAHYFQMLDPRAQRMIFEEGSGITNLSQLESHVAHLRSAGYIR